MGVIEGAWIVEIMRRPYSPVELDTLAVAQYRRLFAVADIQANANARTGLELEGVNWSRLGEMAEGSTTQPERINVAGPSVSSSGRGGMR